MSNFSNTAYTKVNEVSHDQAASEQNSKVNSHKMGDGTTPTAAENSSQPGEMSSMSQRKNQSAGMGSQSY